MKSNLLSLAWLCLSPFLLNAQTYKHYFKASYPLGNEYTNRASILENIEVERPIKSSKVDYKVFKESNDYFIDRFLNSGKVIAYSKANLYLDKVADKLLQNDPALRAKVKFYFVYTTEVNAFTFTNGMIFVNIGLLARLDNEAQLAFIMAHEIAHFKKKHAFERYKFRTESEVKEIDEEEFLEVILSKFSKDQEFEADKIGFEIYKNSGYYLDESVQTFEILKFAEYPVENLRIEKEVFEGQFLKIPQGFYSDSSYQAVFNENDTSLTHPSSVKRQEVLRAQIAATPAGPTGKFLVNEQMFYELKLASQFALSEIYINERDFISSLYNTERLLLKYPANEVLLEQKVQALYFLVANINFGSKSSVIRRPQKIQGEIKKFHQLFKNLTKKEANTLALRLVWDIYLKYPSDVIIKEFTKKVTKHFIVSVGKDLTVFEKREAYNQHLIDSIYALKAELDKQSKRVNSKNSSSIMVKKTQKVGKDFFVKYAIPDLIENQEFKSVFNELVKEVESEAVMLDEEESELLENENLATNGSSTTRKAKKKKSSKKLVNEGKLVVQLDKLLVIEISNVNLDLSSGNPVKFFAIKNKQKELVNTIKTCAKMNGIELVVFNPGDLAENDTAFFNDRSILENWKGTCVANNLNEMLPSNYVEVSEICDRYGTRYVTFINTQTIIIPENQSYYFLNMLYTAYNPPLFVVAMVAVFRNRRYSALQMPIYDIMTGKLVSDFAFEYDVPDHSDFMKAEFYSIFNTIRK